MRHSEILHGDDLGAHFAACAARTRFEDLPAEAVAAAKMVLLDTLGVAVAGWNAPGCAAVHDLAAEWGGRQESTVWVYGTRVPAPSAALANGLMCHALEFDDLHDRAHLHAFAPVLPSALAIAERRGGIDGRTFLTALVLGADVMSRLGLAVQVEKGWHYTLTFGVFGAAVAAGKLLGLDLATLQNALGIAYSHAAGTEQSLVEARLVKRLHPGLAAQAGVTSALLAQRGVSGPERPFEGQLGYFPVYENNHYDRGRALDGLGERFEVANLSIKPYPCCGCTHTAIDATLALVSAAGLLPEEIAEVEVAVSQMSRDLVGAPFRVRDNPQADAQFSIPYAVATAIRRRRVFLEDFEEAAVRDPATGRLASRVRVTVDPHIEQRSLAPATVRIATNDGRRLEARATDTRGHPGNPLSAEELVAKFRGCLAYARQPELELRAGRLVGAVSRIEEMSDVRELAALLSPEKPIPITLPRSGAGAGPR